MPDALDPLDARLLHLLDEHPRTGVLEASRRLGVARGTVQARLDRLQARGVVATLAPTLDPAALGYPLTAFATLEIRQGDRSSVVAHLARLPEVLEAHTITGQGDLLCQLVARDTEDLQRVLDELTGDADVLRSSTIVVLSTVLPRRVLPLADAEAGRRSAPPSRPPAG